MDRSKFNEAKNLSDKIDACTSLLRVPKQNSIYVEVNSLYPTCVVIPVDLWNKIMETVKEVKKQYDKEFNAL